MTTTPGGFSDEDLKRLKETGWGKMLEPLLARLEAAEALLKRLWGDDDMSDEDLDKDREAYEAWRKSCGRKEGL